MVRGIVGPRSSSIASVWYAERSSRDWKCHYWCHGEEESSDPNADCGQAAERGSDVDIAHFPWQVQILARRRGGYEFVCGGALVSRSQVITAAQCFGVSFATSSAADPSSFKVRVARCRIFMQESLALP